MKKVIALLTAIVVMLLSGCTFEKDSDRNDDNSENPIELDVDNDFASGESDKNESIKFDPNLQYWLPVSYKSYYNDGSIKNEANWEYDEEGFVKYLNYTNYLEYWFNVENDGDDVICSYVRAKEWGEELNNSDFASNGVFKLRFDEDGVLIGATYNSSYEDEIEMFSDEEIIETQEKMMVWLDEDGNILPQYNSSRNVYYYSDDSVYYNYTDDWDSLDERAYRDEALRVIACVWKDAVTNSDGTKTTFVYYENGQLAEVIVWRPVSKRAYTFILKNWEYNGTIGLVYRMCNT